MNRIAARAWITLALAVLLVAGLTFFLCEYVSNADQWVVHGGSPHIYNGENINYGVVTDRDSILLLDLTGERTYSKDSAIRKSTVHWIGDRYGEVYAPAISNFSAEIAGYDFLNGVYKYGDQASVVTLSLSAEVQKVALEELSSYIGGTVAVYNYETGELLCAVSTPTCDPDNVSSVTESMYWNRFIQSTYIPGSIFKIVTAAVALETMPDVSVLEFECTGSYMVDGNKVTCESVHGRQDLKKAFSNSCNCAFAQLTLELGGATMERYAKQFGITDVLTFDGIETAEGRFQVADVTDVELAWSGVGQGKDLVNPAAFMTFVGAIANDGQVVNPHLVDRIAVGDTETYTATAQKGRQIMSVNTAKVLQEYMGYTVETKYGSENFPGLTVCAKTGTAEVDGKQPNAMFTGFCTDSSYPLAFIVCVEDAGYGREVCRPIASKVLNAVKEVIDNS